LYIIIRKINSDSEKNKNIKNCLNCDFSVIFMIFMIFIYRLPELVSGSLRLYQEILKQVQNDTNLTQHSF